MAKQSSSADKIMSEKVAKVREVISNVSKNDIILALHSHDLDVERTISALMEGDALDEWVRPAGASGKNKKNKAKKPAEAPKPAAPVTSVRTPAAAPVTIAPSVPLTSQTKKAPVTSSVNGIDKQKVDTSSIEGALAQQEQLIAQWSKECALGRKDIVNTMKSLRQVVDEREKILLAELSRQEDASSRLFANHKQTIENLRAKAASGKDVTIELKAIAKQAEDLLSSNVFSYDMTNVVKQVSAFGRVFSTGVLPTGGASASSATASSPISPPPMKHSGSRSSLVSSVGDDSGLGQGSPVPPEKIPAKVVSSTGAGPIQVASDGLSASQLADLQRQVELQLAASGINTDVLKGVSGGSDIVRRPNKPKGKPAGAAGGQKNNNNKQNNLKLSIFN